LTSGVEEAENQTRLGVGSAFRVSVMRCVQRTNGPISLLIASFVALLTIAQAGRPILTSTLSGLFTVPVHQQLRRACVEEVGNQPTEVIPEPSIISTVEDGDPEPPRLARLEEVTLPAWQLPPVHRKLLPPSPQDG
jgi:hypothetical protein